MRYMVIMNDKTAFVTDWYTHENCWTDEIFCVVDTIKERVTFDGRTWLEMEYDHLQKGSSMEDNKKQRLQEATERRIRSLYWCAFAATVLVAMFGLAVLAAGRTNDFSSLYGTMQFATVMVWTFATWLCYKYDVKIDW